MNSWNEPTMRSIQSAPRVYVKPFTAVFGDVHASRRHILDFINSGLCAEQPRLRALREGSERRNIAAEQALQRLLEERAEVETDGDHPPPSLG